jgi:hypothetical protein
MNMNHAAVDFELERKSALIRELTKRVQDQEVALRLAYNSMTENGPFSLKIWTEAVDAVEATLKGRKGGQGSMNIFDNPKNMSLKGRYWPRSTGLNRSGTCG